MRVRIARHTDRLDAMVAFYRDRVGLIETGSFHDHDGYDGGFLEIPGANAELELTTGGEHGAPDPHPESVVVLYCRDDAEVQAIAERIDAEPVIAANPYWQRNAIAFDDPDGFPLLLVADRS
jgi:catechol 2,3-dioxygenase-like lactoylglutathione lyase family enzyme